MQRNIGLNSTRISSTISPDYVNTLVNSLRIRLSYLFQRLLPSQGTFSADSLRRLRGTKKLKNFQIIGLVFLILLGLATWVRLRSGSEQVDSVNERIQVPGAKAEMVLNYRNEIPVTGAEVAPIILEIEKAEKRDQIIVQGQRANSVVGRTFLVLTIKLTNDNNQPISLNTKNFVRLSVNGNEEEWLAPEVHNYPVEVQAISTKYTRLGFPINDSDTDLRIRVGKIDAEKDTLELTDL